MQSDFYMLDIDNEALAETVLHAQIASVVRPGQTTFHQLSHCPSTCRLHRLTCLLPRSPPLLSGVMGGNWRPSQVQTSSSWNRSCMSCQTDESKTVTDKASRLTCTRMHDSRETMLLFGYLVPEQHSRCRQPQAPED